MVPENIHTPTTEGHWKFQGGGGSQRPKFFKESISVNWNFQRGGEFKPLLGGEYEYFLEQHIMAKEFLKWNKIRVYCTVCSIVGFLHFK